MNDGEGITFSPAEERLLKAHMEFYRDLQTGKRVAKTEAQKHFVKVTMGLAAAETVHKKAFVKFMRVRAQERHAAAERRDPELEGPTAEWFSREDWKKMRGRQRNDGRVLGVKRSSASRKSCPHPHPLPSGSKAAGRERGARRTFS